VDSLIHRWWTGGYNISLIGSGSTPDCELIAQATSYTLHVDKTGHLLGAFVVPARLLPGRQPGAPADPTRALRDRARLPRLPHGALPGDPQDAQHRA
jgi:hypothetical protein